MKSIHGYDVLTDEPVTFVPVLRKFDPSNFIPLLIEHRSMRRSLLAGGQFLGLRRTIKGNDINLIYR